MYLQEKFKLLPFTAVKPGGWLKAQMRNDIDGFVGHLDVLVPELFNDPIYGAGRLHQHSRPKDLGNRKQGDAKGDDQYKWWNSETQSNWWDGYIRHVFLLDDAEGIERVKQYVECILATQDEDGYLGIYSEDIRYKFNAENGELWAKATLFRGLLAFYEATKDEKVWNALLMAVDNVMQNYPIHASSPFTSGDRFNGGVAHGLTITDVLDKLYQWTGESRYVAYALFLYEDFSVSFQSECDAQLKNILNPDYTLKSHGVHTFEHVRPLAVVAFQKPELREALDIYLKRIENATTPTGGPIGDEWIAGRMPDATHTGYEYCSIHELLDSYALLLQKTGSAYWGDAVENIFYNAAQGSRNPNLFGIAYLKTDNSYEMMGNRNGEEGPGKKQTRYKYSPAHQDVAVCCNPNAGRISPYFIQYSWMTENENTLVAMFLAPNILETELKGTKITIETLTNYPFENDFIFSIRMDKHTRLTIKIRRPGWATGVVASEPYAENDGFLVFERRFDQHDRITLSYQAEVSIKTALNGEHYFSYGALIFARPIDAKEHFGRAYTEKFKDVYYEPLEKEVYLFTTDHGVTYVNGVLELRLINARTQEKEPLRLIPLGKTILRQAAFRDGLQ
ncbi:MAG: glycoside hydrolase family 127 protein [Phaeodactylibacter sp.]|nr:glycoside hydrolase family 127 protein [Phaeodactylibacter sp.]